MIEGSEVQGGQRALVFPVIIDDTREEEDNDVSGDGEIE